VADHTAGQHSYSIQFGFQPPKDKNLYGVMLYHHNRLVYPYLRVGVQLQVKKTISTLIR
jgi:hypothetical protein